MGAYSPAPIMTPELIARVMDEIVLPTVAAMQARGTPFKGVLYAGLMIKDGAPKLIEYNVRFGDPEAQVLMMRLKSDLLPALLAVADGDLGDLDARLARRCGALRGDGGAGLSRRLRRRAPRSRGSTRPAPIPTCRSFMPARSATARASWPMAAACSASPRAARTSPRRKARAYAAVDKIDWPDGFCRRDIGWRALRARRTRSNELVTAAAS